MSGTQNDDKIKHEMKINGPKWVLRFQPHSSGKVKILYRTDDVCPFREVQEFEVLECLQKGSSMKIYARI